MCQICVNLGFKHVFSHAVHYDFGAAEKVGGGAVIYWNNFWKMSSDLKIYVCDVYRIV
jgi:hypothetical protein